MTVRFKAIEYHSVHLHKEYGVDDNVLEENDISVERFKEIITHMKDNMFGEEPKGEPPTDEETDLVYDIIHSYSDVIDSEEDWFSDRKGGYDIDYELIEDDE